MNTVKKGNKLEDMFCSFLCAQQDRGELVYGALPAHLCKIYKKKKYYCKEREADVEFDVVIESFREGSNEAYLHIVFECKNYESAIPEDRVTDFSDKIRRIFGHGAKGVMVVSSRLQSGARKIATSRHLGIVKYDESGLDIIAERKGGLRTEQKYLKSQIFEDSTYLKSMKFSAFHEGKFFSSIDLFLADLGLNSPSGFERTVNDTESTVAYITDSEIQEKAHKVLKSINYRGGPVDLEKVCSTLSLDLLFSALPIQDSSGNAILGEVNFDKKSIRINSNGNTQRERFTLGHEIGHFLLRHDRYLRSETIVEQDLFADRKAESCFNYERLEHQANAFASALLLPENEFRVKVNDGRNDWDIKDIGHGYIFVDEQPCNKAAYEGLLMGLSSNFDVSKQAIEIKLKKMGLLNDHRLTARKVTIHR